MTQSILEVADEPEPDTIATPEGDAEFPRGEVLSPTVVQAELAGLQIPNGSAPAPPEDQKPSLLEAVLDEISHGNLLP